MNGPYDTYRQAADAAHDIISPGGGSSILTPEQNRQLIGQALEAAGVTCGQYDDKIIGWLASLEDATCMVIAGLVTRAHQTAGPPGLTEADHTVMARARGLAAATEDSALRAWFRSQGNTDAPLMIAGPLYASALNAAQELTGELLGLAEKLGGHPYPASPDQSEATDLDREWVNPHTGLPDCPECDGHGYLELEDGAECGTCYGTGTATAANASRYIRRSR